MTAFEKVLALLKDPKEEWTFGDYTCDHRRTGLSIWVKNVPVLDTNLYRPTSLSLNLFQKWKLWQAVKVARDNALLRAMEQPKADS